MCTHVRSSKVHTRPLEIENFNLDFIDLKFLTFIIRVIIIVIGRGLRMKKKLKKLTQKHETSGISFNKNLGQHILKNPLVVASMIEKVCFDSIQTFIPILISIIFLSLCSLLSELPILFSKLVPEPAI